MIKPISVQFKYNPKPQTYMAIVIDYLQDVENVREFRDNMLNILMGCLGSEKIMENFTADSLWWLTKLIDATTTIIEQPEKGGTV